MKIQKLPAEARSKLQSALAVTDAVHCVIELVQNSIDAEATGIAVLIDLKNFQIKVIDNGKGIGKDDLEYVGERFMTSKYQSFIDLEISFPTYGYSGQALSSLQEVSRSLTIETKSEDGGPTFVKVFQSSKALPIRETGNERNGTGTAVTIEGFMYKMPVRRNRISEVFDLEEIKSQLQYLAIIHYNVCFTLKNENKGIIMLQTPQASSILQSVKNIYGKNVANSLTTLHYKDKNYKVAGFLSVKSQIQSSLQLIYINGRIIAKSGIHKFINNLMKKYIRKQSLLADSPMNQIIKSLKVSSHHNVFIILIRCPRLLCELFTDIRKTTVEFKNWTDVLKCVHKAVKGAFKNALNMDCSSSQHDENTCEGDKEAKKAFGTSLLVNAVKGAPVKRGFDSKGDAKKRKKLKLNDNKKKSKAILKNDNSKENDKELICGENQKRETNDSIESPIPKKNFKLLKKDCDSTCKKISEVNHSFVEFYEWLKTKSDANAFKLYNDFLQFKSRTNYPSKISEFKSPVLGVKLKRKGNAGLKKKNLEKITIKALPNFSGLDEEVKIERNHSKIFSNSHIRIKRGSQAPTEMHSGFPESLNLGSVNGGILNFEKCNSQFMFRNPENVPVLNRNQEPIGFNPTTSSLASSDVQFINIIKFRNLSESSFHHSPHAQIAPREKRLGPVASNSWQSHYEDFASESAEPCEKEIYISRLGAPEVPRRNKDDLKNMCNFSGVSFDFFEYTNKVKEAVTLRDVEIQVDILKAPPVKKVNAMIQTFQFMPETPSSANSCTGVALGNKNYPAIKGFGSQKEQGIQLREKNLSQEVPDPDFWNTSEYMELEQVADIQFASGVNEIISKNLTTNEKNYTSIDFICGQRSSIKSSNQQNDGTSKETIAAPWTDSLTDMQYLTEKGSTTVNPNLSGPKSYDAQFSKAISNEEIGGEISRLTEPGFCLTERHDFVPKGLSPKFINPEPTKISMLSPREKCKVKFTIDNVQNDALADIKWQDESTGDCLKPKIPDEIFFEMNRRAGESVLNYGDPVLSATLSYCAVKVHHLLHSFTFTKELLSGIEILGQLDKKFIVATVKILTPKKMELISLFDQHAVDERIKLEELINENISIDGKFISSFLNPPVECKLPESDVCIISEFTEKILNFGLSVEVVNENTVLVIQAPSFLLNKHEKDLKSKKETSLSDTLKSLIGNILEEITETRGAGSKIPKVLHSIFCLEACHKAIRFNKALSLEKMTEMINKLRNCSLPFQCAHGRPSVIPIIDLEDFRPAMEEKENVDLQKLKSFFYGKKEDDMIQNSETVY